MDQKEINKQLKRELRPFDADASLLELIGDVWSTIEALGPWDAEAAEWVKGRHPLRWQRSVSRHRRNLIRDGAVVSCGNGACYWADDIRRLVGRLCRQTGRRSK
jgi:hypothetical protein